MKKISLLLAALMLVGCNSTSTKETSAVESYKLKRGDSLIIREGNKDVTGMFTVDLLMYYTEEGTKYKLDGSNTMEDFDITAYFFDNGIDVDVKNEFYISYRGNVSYSLLKA